MKLLAIALMVSGCVRVPEGNEIGSDGGVEQQTGADTAGMSSADDAPTIDGSDVSVNGPSDVEDPGGRGGTAGTDANPVVEVADGRVPTTDANSGTPEANAGPWQPAGAGREPPIGALPAGQQGATTFYACRVPFGGGVHGGKAFPRGNCNFAWGGRELMMDTYEVLVGAFYTWQPANGPLTTIPVQAVLSGQEASGASLYVCRAQHKDGVHPGKLSVGRCNIGFAGQEVILDTFDILLTGPPPNPADPFDRTKWLVTASSSDGLTPPIGAIDGDRLTRWSSGRPQKGDEVFHLDLGAVATLTQLSLDCGASVGDFPVKYELALSLDDLVFTTIATGSGAAVLTIPVTPTRARYLRIKQTGQSSPGGQWWTIAELTIAGR